MRRAGTFCALLLVALVAVGFHSTDSRRVIYVRNVSTLADAKIKKAIPAFQTAVHRDFAPVWDTDARLVFIGNKPAPRGAWVIVVNEYADCLGCAGFHDYRDGHAYAEVSRYDGWQDTFTHELFELLADPYVQADGSNGRMIATATEAYLVEVSDPVVGLHYKIGGVTIADFVYPAWYMPGAAGDYDRMGVVPAPLKLMPGGYAWKLVGGEWTEA